MCTVMHLFIIFKFPSGPAVYWNPVFLKQTRLTEQEVGIGEYWLKSWGQTKHSEVCTHGQGQHSHMQTD